MANAEQARELLGTGLYTPSEVAFYAKISPQLVYRWFAGLDDERAVIKTYKIVDDQKFINFLDFIQTLAIRAIRIKTKVPLHKIREAIERAKKDYGVEYPFAMEHVTELALFKKEVFLYLPKREQYAQLTGKGRDNMAFKEVVETYQEKIIFDKLDGLAKQYRPAQNILMDPRIRFGEPIVESCGYTARVIYDAVNTEGSIKAAARAYGISEEDTRTAHDYIDSLQPAA